MYIYNGVANLGELKEVSLSGASLFFNGSFRLEDLQGVELRGANVFLNGQLQVRRPIMTTKCANGSQSTTNEKGESTPTSSRHLPQNANHLPLGLNQNVADSQQERTSDTTSDHFERPARPVRDHARRASAATPVACQQQKNTQCANSRARDPDLLPGAIHKFRSSNPLASTNLARGLTDDPDTLTPQKRTSVPDVLSTTKTTYKKPKLEKHNGSDLDRPTDRLIQEEAQRSKRARQLSDSGNGHDATAEYKKIRELSNRRKEIQSQVGSQRPGPLATPPTGPRSSSDQEAFSGAFSQMSIVPQNSPLGNVIHSATLHEQTVQAKIKFKIAQNQLLEEKAARGAPSKATTARVRSLNETLAFLHRRRNEIGNDANRMEAFRRSDRGHQHGAEDLTRTTPDSPPLSPTDSEWRNRLTLCYEAVESPKSLREHIQIRASESATLSEEEGPIIKQEHSDENRLWSIGKIGHRVRTRAQQRQVRFALTDVETCL
jgi:hypothetical protein